MDESWDLVVVGGGIVGAMTAYLARERRPDWGILVLEQSRVAGGATRRSLGFDLPYASTPYVRRLVRRSAPVYDRLRREIPDLPIQAVETFGVAQRSLVAKIESSFSTAKQFSRSIHGNDWRLLQRTFGGPAIGSDQTLLSLGTCYRGSAARVTERLRQHRVHDTHYREGVRVDGIHAAGHQLELHTCDGRGIRARRVVLATGPWLPTGPAGRVARAQGIRVKKVAALVINRAPSTDAPALCLFDDDAFLLPQTERRRWLFSFTADEWNCRPDKSTLILTAEERSAAMSIIKSYCPEWVGDCVGERVFCDAYGPDALPTEAKVADIPDVVIAGACAGSGYRLAPALALEALERLSGIERQFENDRRPANPPQTMEGLR